MKASGRDWSGIKGGKRAVVEAVTVRDLCAPDPGVQPQGGQPNSAAAGRNIALKEADPIKLEKKRFTNHTATLRALRVFADGVTSLSDVKKGSYRHFCEWSGLRFQVGGRPIAQLCALPAVATLTLKSRLLNSPKLPGSS